MAVLRAADDIFKLGLSFTPLAIGLAALRAQGTTLPQAAVDAAKAADGVILGPVSHHDYPPLAQGGLNPSGELRKRLDLFANIRPARSRGGFPPRCGSTSSSRARTPRATTPTAPCSSAPASSCPRRIWRSPCARSPARARRGSRRLLSRSPSTAARR